MLKIIFYSLIIVFSVSLFSACIADRKSSSESSQTRNVKSEEIQKAKSKEDDSEKSTAKNDAEKSAMKQDSLDDEPEINEEDKTDKTTVNKSELRCGWYSNPTPGNHWLQDKDGEWTIGVQGGFQAEGDYPPEFSDSQWVNTNGYYGYGCVCLRVIVDRKEQRILKVIGGNAKPLSACRNDPALSEPSE